MKIYFICCLSALIPYLEKILFLRHDASQSNCRILKLTLFLEQIEELGVTNQIWSWDYRINYLKNKHGINWFFTSWYRLMEIKNWLNTFWWVRVWPVWPRESNLVSIWRMSRWSELLFCILAQFDKN